MFHMYITIREKGLWQLLMTFLLNQTLLSHPSLATSWDTVWDLWWSKDWRAKKCGNCGEAPTATVCPCPFSPKLKVTQAVIARHFLYSNHSQHKFPLGHNWITCSGFCYLSTRKS